MQHAHEVEPRVLRSILARVPKDDGVVPRIEPVVAMRTPGGVLLEARRATGEGPGGGCTMVLKAHVDTADAVDEMWWARFEPAAPVSFDPAVALADTGTGVPEASAVFRGFLAALGDGPTAAAACFAAEGVFSHAAYVPGGPRILVTGPEAIAAALADRRPGPPDLEVVALVQVGRWAMIDGWANSPLGRKPFVSSFTMDASGRLLRYLSVGVSRHS